MTFAQILAELNGAFYGRFDANQNTSITHWINQSYGHIWAAADWPWKKTTTATTTSANTRTINSWGTTGTMSAVAFAPYLITYPDDNASLATGALERVTMARYTKEYLLSGTASTGIPRFWAFLGGTIYLGPVPDAVYTLNVLHDRNIFLRDSSTWSTTFDGIWDGSATRQPAWSEPFHYVIVLGAQYYGLVMENDPTADEARLTFLNALEMMKQHFVSPDPGGTQQLSADNL